MGDKVPWHVVAGQLDAILKTIQSLEDSSGNTLRGLSIGITREHAVDVGLSIAQKRRYVRVSIRAIKKSWSFGHGHLVIFDFGNAVIAHYI